MAKKSETLLPEDSAAPSFDASSLRVNFSDREASSEARSFEPMPTGKYHAAITEWEMKASTSEKHNGKPYWALTLVVQSGPYEDRKLWANVMLFEGALYSLSQLMKAIGREDVLKSGEIPHGDELIGEELIAVVVKKRDKYKEEKEEDGEKYFKNEVTGFKPLSAASERTASGSGSLLPG